MPLEITRGSVDDIDSLEPLWVAVHHAHQAAMPELAPYVETFERTGFTGGINWYRNLDGNWETTSQIEGATIDVPSLMVTAEWDAVLRPELAEPMRALVPDLEIHMIPRCGHWTPQDKPAELNAVMIDWLRRRFG